MQQITVFQKRVRERHDNTNALSLPNTFSFASEHLGRLLSLMHMSMWESIDNLNTLQSITLLPMANYFRMPALEDFLIHRVKIALHSLDVATKFKLLAHVEQYKVPNFHSDILHSIDMQSALEVLGKDSPSVLLLSLLKHTLHTHPKTQTSSNVFANIVNSEVVNTTFPPRISFHRKCHIDKKPPGSYLQFTTNRFYSTAGIIGGGGSVWEIRGSTDRKIWYTISNNKLLKSHQYRVFTRKRKV